MLRERLSFYHWLQRKNRRQNPAGDFARDVRQDRESGCMPEDATSVDAIIGHIATSHGAFIDEHRGLVRRLVGDYAARYLPDGD